MGWRFYASRTVGGLWLDTDVNMRATVTTELNGPGSIVATLPPAYDVTAKDGAPLWVERGTTLYAEADDQLAAVGLLRFTRPTESGRLVEFSGLSSLYDLVAFEGRINRWEANPYAMVELLLEDAHDQPDGDVGFRVVRDGRPPGFAGDEKPPDAPRKPKRRRGENAGPFQQRVNRWEREQQAWDKAYGDRQPYSLGYWEQQYVGAEIAELADECRFDFREAHRWSDRDALAAEHDLELSRRTARRREDLALVEGVNLFGVLDPETTLETYGNNVVALGAGEGRKMRRAQYGRRDGRVRTTRFVEAKAVRQTKRLRQRARSAFGRAEVVTQLREAVVPDAVAAQVSLGDELRVESRDFEGWPKVTAVVRDTGGDPATLRFDSE